MPFSAGSVAIIWHNAEISASRNICLLLGIAHGFTH